MLKKIFFAIVIILAAVCVSGAIFKPDPPTEKVEVAWTVHAGQTKWAVVSQLMKEYGDKRDLREVLWEMDKANGIKGHTIHPGQTIYITLEATK